MARTTRPQTKHYDYKVVMEPLALQDGSPSGWMGTKRTDSGQVLGVCTEQYGIMDNSTLFGGVEQTFEDLGMTDYEKNVTVVRDGARVYGRYDFKNVGARVELSGETITMAANSEERCKAVLDVLQTKLVKRGVSLKHLEYSNDGEPRASGKEYRLEAALTSGISSGKNWSAPHIWHAARFIFDCKFWPCSKCEVSGCVRPFGVQTAY